MTKSLASNTNLVVIESKLPPKAETHKMLINALRIIRTSESLPMNSKSKISWHLWVFIDSEFQRWFERNNSTIVYRMLITKQYCEVTEIPEPILQDYYMVLCAHSKSVRGQVHWHETTMFLTVPREGTTRSELHSLSQISTTRVMLDTHSQLYMRMEIGADRFADGPPWRWISESPPHDGSGGRRKSWDL